LGKASLVSVAFLVGNFGDADNTLFSIRGHFAGVSFMANDLVLANHDRRSWRYWRYCGMAFPGEACEASQDKGVLKGHAFQACRKGQQY